METRDDPTREERPPRTAEATPRIRESGGIARPSDRFVMGAELGRGGMGRVVAAVDTALDREVAIKQALSDETDAARFEREARITAQLEHPSIVPIHDAGRDEHGRPYYIMRRIAGEPLADRIVRAPDAKARLALVPRFVVAVDAAAFAHARGIVHRDIKPWNILLGSYGETLLIDWGLARRLDETEPDGERSGTPGYMAPEQARGETSDARADVYALGATLLDVLTGSIGRGLASPTEWIARAAAGKLPPVEKLAPEIPAELVAIVAKALAPEPADRYRDAGELAADLHAFLDGRLVGAHRYTAIERALRFVRRHRLVVAITVLALASVAAIGVVAIDNVIDERDAARAARLDAEAEQRVATDRADVLLLDRAQGLAERDPTRAAALLARLPVGSHHAARARDIAAIAALHGIEHGRVAHDGAITSLAIAPDGRRLLTTGGYDGTIQIDDLATGTARTVARGPVVDLAIWTNRGATITYAVKDGVRIVDVATGAVRTLAREISTAALWAPDDAERVRIHDDKRRTVVEIATSGGEPRVLAHDAVTVADDGERFAVAGAGTVRVVDATGEHVVAHYTGGDPARLALAGDGSRIAAAFHDRSSEWDIATGREMGVWPGIAFAIVYADGRLYGSNLHRSGQLDLLVASGTRQVLAADWSVMWTTRAGPRIAIVDASGDLGLLGADGRRELRFDRAGSRMIAGRADSPYLAVGSSDGTIRWWDLRQFVPESHTVSNGVLCAIDAERIYIRPVGSLAVVPRAGGATRTVDSEGLDCAAGRVGTKVVATAHGAFDIVDGATGRRRHVDGKPILGRRAIYAAHGRTFYEITDRGQTALWTAPADIAAATLNDRAFAIALADGRLVRVDAASGAATPFSPAAPVRVFGLAADDTWWYASSGQIYHGDRMLGELPARAELLWIAPGGDCMVVAGDRSVWRVGARGPERVTSLGSARAISIGQRVIATLQLNTVRLAYLETGERMTLPVRDAAEVHLFENDRILAVVRRTDITVVDIYTDSVPADPARLGDWLRTATNAVAEPGNDAVTWR